MLKSVNFTAVTGRIGRKPELRELDSSGAVEVSMRVVTVHRYKKGTEWKEEAQSNWVEVVGDRRDIGWVADLQEGDVVTVTGRLKRRKYEKPGEKYDVYVIHCDSESHSVVCQRPRRPTPRAESSDDMDPIPS